MAHGPRCQQRLCSFSKHRCSISARNQPELRSAKTPDARGEGGHILNIVQASVYIARFFRLKKKRKEICI